LQLADAASACFIRRVPSKLNGLVTTATVKSHLAGRTRHNGAAPVPVPPPIPAVTNTMCYHEWLRKSLRSFLSAAAVPMSGLAPAPKPSVNCLPSCSFTSAGWRSSTCKSVLAMAKSPRQLSANHVLHRVAAAAPTPITMSAADGQCLYHGDVERHRVFPFMLAHLRRVF